MFSRIEQTHSDPSSTLLFDENYPTNQDVIGGSYPDFFGDFPCHLDDLSKFNLDDISWLMNK